MKVTSATVVTIFILSLLYNPNRTNYYFSSKRDTILLVSMNFREQHLVDAISKKVTSFYHLPVKHIFIRLPAAAYYSQRSRYRADSIINYLTRLDRNIHKFVAALTSVDISVASGKVEDWEYSD